MPLSYPASLKVRQFASLRVCAKINVYHACVLTDHISFLCEDGIVETLQGHPFVGQLHIGSVVLSEVAASIDVLSQTKVSHPDTPSRVQPKGINHTIKIIVILLRY